MLQSGADVKALDPRRDPKKEDSMHRACSAELRPWRNGLGILMNVGAEKLCGRRTRMKWYKVDPERIRAAKQKAVDGGAEFVSTNDILAAFWSRASNANALSMAMNLRGRADGVVDDLAGMYSKNPFWADDGSLKPADIRRSLEAGAPFGCMPVPGFFETLFMRIALTTNWSSFFEELRIDGCEQVRPATHEPTLIKAQAL
mmetsp:Transcript_23610/g.74175  ORF Transcript_23610/g.74175 Transcript_23610/m.74175 type:complete len:201 (+) Transcript_23610:463-1065(+)